jgi:outer membrane immunogenic protein
VRRLRLAIVGIGILAAGAGPASAADWTGWTVGISAGGGVSRSAQTDSGISCAFFGTGKCSVPQPGCPTTGPCPRPGSPLGGLVGGEIGYNFWQTGPWVFGVTGDYSWAGIGGDSDTCGAGGPEPRVCGTTLQSLGTFRGSIGYAPDLFWLVYGTAGYAGGELHAWDSLTQASGSSFMSGWSAGAGVQVLLIQNLWVKFEYLHVDLGHAVMFDIVPGVPETVSLSSDIFRVGLDFKFNSYPPPYLHQIVTK